MERDIKHVKGLALFGFCVVAGLVLAGSVAYACTTWVGQMEVTGNGSGSGTVKTIGENRSGIMNYCPSDSSTDLDGGWPDGRARVARTGTRTLTIVVKENKFGTTGSKRCKGPNDTSAASYEGQNATANNKNALPAGDYWVTYKHTGFGDSVYGTNDSLTRQFKVDCMKSAVGPASGGGKTFDTANTKLTVNASGDGNENFSATDTWTFSNISGVDEAVVCVSGQFTSSGGVTTQWGNQAPFFVI